MRWLIGGLLLVVAAAGTWYAVTSAAFWAALVPIIAAAIMPAVFKRKDPKAEVRDHQDHRQRIDHDITGRERRR